ncbi:vomeronasal type-1 receptor 4-like [Petaurus breviceps papuanus]|uniref:vomeronasal type-1 receptor 4-like n=1 Tax=Petaurus breviceps papuanus TaxID=3040969 RepID=UPI0036DE8D94
MKIIFTRQRRPQQYYSVSVSIGIFFFYIGLGIVFFMQTATGLLGNFFLLCHCISTFLTGSKMRPVDSILFHLALANSMGLISKGVPQTMFSSGMKNFIDRIGCKLIVFLHRVARSLSINNTCLLSGFHIITINPFACSRWSTLKTYASVHIFPFCLFCWIMHILTHIYMFVNMPNLTESSNNTRIWNLGFCSDYASTSFKDSLFIIVYSIPDFLCVVFMVMASGYLVLLLQRYHQQVQHIRSSSLLSRKSPEIRATYTILVLVSTYVSFYSVNSIFSFYLFKFDKHYQWLMPTIVFLDACYPAISPFVLISSDSQILCFFYSLWQQRRSQDSLFPRRSIAQNSISIFTKKYL